MKSAKKTAPAKTKAVSKKAAEAAGQDHSAAFSTLCEVFADVVPKLQVLTRGAKEYNLHTQVASPLKQHKGAPMFFGSVRNGKAYSSFHLFPLYMNANLTASISSELRKRMQGKTCFNFKTLPDPELLTELKALTKAGLQDFEKRGWA